MAAVIATQLYSSIPLSTSSHCPHFLTLTSPPASSRPVFVSPVSSRQLAAAATTGHGQLGLGWRIERHGSCLQPWLERRRRGKGVCRTMQGGGDEGSSVYQGAYGPWRVERSDVVEVVAYRAGLVTCAAAAVVASLPAFLPASSPAFSLLSSSLDALYLLSLLSLGLSLSLIHIYVTPIKRALQALWALGLLGSSALLLLMPSDLNQSQPGLVLFVVSNHWAVWLVGPAFAALTGLVFKEGLCYGKLEAALLTFVIPTLLLGHLSSLMPEDVEQLFLGIWMALFVLFALRKFTQPIKDDIGDKSVFVFQALPREEQQLVLDRMKLGKGDNDL